MKMFRTAGWIFLIGIISVLAACGGGAASGSGSTSSAKAISTFSLAGMTGTINETSKAIAVTMPFGTDVTALVATFATTGASVTVATTKQISGTTSNDFTNPVTYTVTAGDGSKASYTVTVAVALSSYPVTTRNYLDTSYELSKYTTWFSSDNILSNGVKYTGDNPLLVIQTTQLDVNADGLEDIFTYDSYPMDVLTPNPPPSLFISDGVNLNKTQWNGPALQMPHGVKLLLGDFNNDGYPDIFSLVAIDPPFGAFPNLTDYNHILYGSATGFSSIKEFNDQLGFWYTGASGDIDKDGDLDIVMFNFHNQANGVQNKILWNNGNGNFAYDANGIGDIPLVDAAELVDVNNDGFLDLVIDNILTSPTRSPRVSIMWGNGSGFSLANSTTFQLQTDQYIADIGFADINSDGIKELFISGSNLAGTSYWVEIFSSGDSGISFIDNTTTYFDNNLSTTRFDHIRVQDIDANGKLDIFAPDKKDNIRWEWNGTKFVRQ